MNRIPVVIDCDTGVDDAIALLMAIKSPELDIRGITTVSGNVDVDKTTVNTLRILDIACADIPVFRGASAPLMREKIIAPNVHGINGLGDLDLPLPSRAPEKEKASDAICRIARSAGGSLELIAVGPLTNLAHAFIQYKALPSLLKRIVIMGGAVVGGNATPVAEFNIYADPEAADIVFRSGVPVHMCGLDVTMQGYVTRGELCSAADTGSRVALFLQELTKGYYRFSESYGLPGMCMHDPVAVTYACCPEMFTYEEAGVRVETKGRLTYGKTVCDLYSDKQFDDHNAVVVTGIDRHAFLNRFYDMIGAYR